MHRTFFISWAKDAAHAGARRPKPSAAPVYWLGQVEPAREPNFFDATRKFGPLMRLVLPDERPGVNRGAVDAVQNFGVVKRLVFKDKSSLEVRYNGPSSDLCNA
jgi:hypothetical protein